MLTVWQVEACQVAYDKEMNIKSSIFLRVFECKFLRARMKVFRGLLVGCKKG